MFKKLIKKNKNQPIQSEFGLDLHNIPEHVAIIMDGNGRWAKQRKLPRIKGHYQGMQTVKKITKVASDIGIKYLTLYAFSTENWTRPENEVNYIMNLPVNFLKTFLPELIENNVKVETIGFMEYLPSSTLKAIAKAKEDTKDNTGLKLIFAINYGGRAEILNSVKTIYDELTAKGLTSDDITEQMIDDHLMTHAYPDPDLLIRTSGEQRISNFLIWQVSYSEFIFNEKLWPDFDKEELINCIKIYQSRQRRFGGL
ncbi:UDP pyrophosphate synthase [Staphylococcus saprophyticus]|uniref:Isoprenyl transferase n=4 Tax=Staphylococcus TaxID=1279 RepID=ISPT_STAS1|nr:MULTISPECIES: isoprenyl transferase [Staphylococcus]Q49X45.1 RecName: Full=Isoprenyl transferase [Staphylococcus saprophyticus subsp. saprophyticus ATCC 15305 = NCTC 7292]CRV21180.1 undecaprenyl pyrophosphate synthetase [Streptococcus equi subsp. equi]AMG20593.1 isoprenyl transferase [Staphylococcus saprophyticus]AMG33704.1 isoprenyl transferase [Staphylococcus saprophyticus]ASE59550.1 isoprenyl transferase [Staphylococcus saprophyticus]ASF18333.1 isoprenyl transferase [Staphylococcus sapr